jgi:HPt (histidine-containing phosphotransfer) domain-containing protein
VTAAARLLLREHDMRDADASRETNDLDENMVDQLAACGVLEEVAALYLDEAVTLLSRIEAACESRDGGELARAAHALKGASGSVGARRVMLLCAEIERAARRDPAEEAFEATTRLEGVLVAATNSLARRAGLS